MIMKKNFTSAVLLVLIVCCFGLLSGCNKDSGLEYAYTDTTSAVLSGTNCKQENLSIPSKYDGKPVIGISEYAFVRNGNIKTVTLPEGITYIGAGAFYSCYKLTEISLPSTLAEIDYVAFKRCEKLNTIKYNGTKQQWYQLNKCYLWDDDTSEYTITCTDGELTKTQNGNNKGTAGLIYEMNLSSLSCVLQSGLSAVSAEVTVPEKYYNYNVEKIGDNAFFNGKITSVRLENGIRQIGESAFENCAALKTVYLPSTLNRIEKRSFASCSALTDIYFNGVRADWNAMTKDAEWDENSESYILHCLDDE